MILKTMKRKYYFIIFILTLCFLCSGCTKTIYMVDIDTGKKNRMIFVDKHIKTDKTGQNGQYYVTKIEEYPGLAVIYLSYEGKSLVVLSKQDKSQGVKNKIEKHKFYSLSLIPTLDTLYKSPKLMNPLPPPQIYDYAGYVIYWESKNITEKDVYLSPELDGDGLNQKDPQKTFLSSFAGKNKHINFYILTDSTVEVIGGDYFHLDSIFIPDKVSFDGKEYSVTSIGNDVFGLCTGLTFINIPNSVTSIGQYAFYGCSGLTSIAISNRVKSIEYAVFAGCTGLNAIVIPNSVTSIGSNAFSECTGLTSINIPNSVTSIGSNAFSECTGLTSINIPNSVSYIGHEAFAGCANLDIVINNKRRNVTIEKTSFDGVKSVTWKR